MKKILSLIVMLYLLSLIVDSHLVLQHKMKRGVLDIKTGELMKITSKSNCQDFLSQKIKLSKPDDCLPIEGREDIDDIVAFGYATYNASNIIKFLFFFFLNKIKKREQDVLFRSPKHLD